MSIDLPPYRLQHVLSGVKELLGANAARAGSKAPEICCAQAIGGDIYVGCSNGSLLRYALVNSFDSSPESYQLLMSQAMPSGQPIEKIALIPSVEMVLVLSDRQIHFFSYPNLEPVEEIKPARGVVTFTWDETKLPTERRPGLQESIRLCVLKRNDINVYTLTSKHLQFRKGIPFQTGAISAKLANQNLCLADSNLYSTIDIDTTVSNQVLPVSQAGDSIEAKPLSVVISMDEFLVLSWTDTGTIGISISGAGDPVPGRDVLQWPVHPLDISYQSPYVVALIPDGTIIINNLESQSPPQNLSPPKSFQPIRLERSCNGYFLPASETSRALEIVDFPPLEPEAPDSSAIEESAIDGRATNTSNPPSRKDSIDAPISRQASFRPQKAVLLAIGTDAIYGFSAVTILQQVDALLEVHKLKEATDFVKEQQKRLEDRKRKSMIHPVDCGLQEDEIRYAYQRLGYTYLAQTNFEDAGINLFRGNVDPWLLIRLFPDLRGGLSSLSAPLPVFQGLLPQLRSLCSIDTIIKNYTPHLRPNTRSAPSTSELRKHLLVLARDMLKEYLRKWKNKAMYSGETLDPGLSQIIDTVQAKIFAESEETQELYTLIASSDSINVEEVEETLIRTGQYNALLKIYMKLGRREKLLEVWSKLVDGEWTDDDVRDPLSEMIKLLAEMRDRALTQRWALWIVQRNVETGLKLLLSIEGRRSKADDHAMLSQLESLNPEAGRQFLEHIILQKRNHDPELHTRLAHTYVESLTSILQEEQVAKFFRDAVFEYSIQRNAIPFLTHLASAEDPSSPMFQHVRIRCRAALFLQGSSYYDVLVIRDKLLPWEEILSFEIAIVDGKLGRHEEALRLLVHNLRDTTCADAYCGLGGYAISPKVAQFVGERFDLQPWADIIITALSRRLGPGRGGNRSREFVEETKRQLLKILLEVYMSDGQETENHAARLLNTQGGNLNVMDVLTLVPSKWSLQVVSSFLARSLRHSVHDHCEGEILKAVALGQNLAVRDEAYSLFHNQGAIIEESAPGSEGSPLLTGSVDGDDGTAFTEKTIIVVDANAPVEDRLVSFVDSEGGEES